MKTITNQVKPEELQKKIAAIDAPPTETSKLDANGKPITETPVVTDPPVVENEDAPLELNDILATDPDKLTDKEQTFLEENQEKLTDEQKFKFHIIEEMPKKKEEAAPATKEINIDYKARYSGSTQEAQVLAARNKEFIEATDKAKALPLPTDDEMMLEYPEDWEVMNDRQRKNAKIAKLQENKDKILSEVTEKMKKSVEWRETTKKHIENPAIITQYPQLAGHEEEFVQFCSLPSRVGLSYDDLIKAFSFDLKPNTPAPQRKSLFETGSGGGITPKAPKALSTEEIAYLRKNNPKEYKRLSLAGKINVDL